MTQCTVFSSRINPKELNAARIKWTEGLDQCVEGKVVTIDGKALRGSFDNATGKGALHLISAWVEKNSLIFGQVVVEGKHVGVKKI